MRIQILQSVTTQLFDDNMVWHQTPTTQTNLLHHIVFDFLYLLGHQNLEKGNTQFSIGPHSKMLNLKSEFEMYTVIHAWTEIFVLYIYIVMFVTLECNDLV